MKRLCGLLAILFISSVCFAGPFGFEYGMTKQQVVSLVGRKAILSSEADTLKLSTAPKPHRAIEYYVLIFSPQKGLLKIVGVGNDITTNDFGDQLQEEFHKIAAAVAGSYGSPSFELDSLKPDSIWHERNEWMIGLLKQERFLGSVWNTPTPRLAGVVVEALALSGSTGYIRVTYEFTGWNEYVDEKVAKQNQAF